MEGGAWGRQPLWAEPGHGGRGRQEKGGCLMTPLIRVPGELPGNVGRFEVWGWGHRGTRHTHEYGLLSLFPTSGDRSFCTRIRMMRINRIKFTW